MNADDRPEGPSKSSEQNGERLVTLAETLAGHFDHGPRPTEPDLPHGIALAAPYEDRGEVARGGMGSVRGAWDRDLQRQVAVKVVAPRLLGDPVAVQRFVQEARITGQLDHPNVVPVHLLSTTPEGHPCLVMKLVEGCTLSTWLAARAPGPWSSAALDEVLGIFLKVCDAVSFAHSRRVVHRDLKPDNIMVGEFGQVYVMDWGIARILPRDGEAAQPAQPGQPVTSRGPIGTPVYMAPEQALRYDPDISERTDVFLLGAVLYEILTGRPPHQGPSLVAVLYRAMTGQIPAPEEAAPERAPPPGLARVAMKAMSRLPADRYESVQALKRDIERFLRGEERFPTRTFAAGETLIVEGREGEAAYVIVSGRAAAFRTRDGERVVLREMGPGDVFGETAIFTARPTSASVEALEELTVKVVTRDSLSESLGLHTWMGAFVRSLAERFREVDDRLRAMERDSRRSGEPPPR